MNPLYDLERNLGELEGEYQAEPARAPFSLEQLPSVWSINQQVEWLVPGLIASAALTLLTGDSGVGKSTVALAIAGAVVHGLPFLGRETRQKAALYVDGENPVGVVRERLERLGIAETDLLTVWGGWNDPAPFGPAALSVIEWARKHQGLIVYDSLIQFHTGSEQDSSETRRYLANYRTLANAGASVLLLHHTGKGENSKQYRGSTDIKAAVDQAFCLKAVGDGEGGPSLLRLEAFKARIAEVEPLRLDFSNGVFKLANHVSRTNREVLEDLIERNPERSGREITALATAAGVAKNRCEALLIEGARDGWLIPVPGPRNSRLYRLRGPDD